jgi:acyl-coenzyme A thioesterase PaaI-like protein
MLVSLDNALRTVPMLATLGIRAEEARTGHLVLRLPLCAAVTNHSGALHTAAIFAVGELCAAVVLGTHPTLSRYVQLQKSTKIKYYAPSLMDVTAHAKVTPEMIETVDLGLAASRNATAQIDVPVQVLDGRGNDVAELVSRFVFRAR